MHLSLISLVALLSASASLVGAQEDVNVIERRHVGGHVAVARAVVESPRLAFARAEEGAESDVLEARVAKKGKKAGKGKKGKGKKGGKAGAGTAAGAGAGGAAGAAAGATATTQTATAAPAATATA